MCSLVFHSNCHCSTCSPTAEIFLTWKFNISGQSFPVRFTSWNLVHCTMYVLLIMWMCFMEQSHVSFHKMCSANLPDTTPTRYISTNKSCMHGVDCCWVIALVLYFCLPCRACLDHFSLAGHLIQGVYVC